MPDPDSKKNQQKKGKNDPKDQRKPRQQRSQAAGEKKSEKRTDEARVAAPEKQEFEEPGPEFYKGLKRETDDILKITEDANSKYKKKEIKSNWAKYEVPIESYDDIEEQENLGADYEQLIQAPLSLGGHFQFKHEKSWDITTCPSLYDKYFDINTNDLATALCTIPFYERNAIDKSIFSETDILTMDQRTSRYKHKYYKISTVESEIQDKFINSLREDVIDVSKTDETQDERKSESDVDRSYENEINFDESKLNKTEVPKNEDKVEIVFKRDQDELTEPMRHNKKQNEVIDDIDDIIVETTKSLRLDKKLEVIKPITVPETKVVNKGRLNLRGYLFYKSPERSVGAKLTLTRIGKKIKTGAEAKRSSRLNLQAPPAPTEPNKNPVIESPEDLEKWLDDFLEE